MKTKGISLIVLVITILVLAILATTVIISLNNTNIIEQAGNTVREHNLQTLKEAVNLKVISHMAEHNGAINMPALKAELEEFGPEYVVSSSNNSIMVTSLDGTMNVEVKDTGAIVANSIDNGVLYSFGVLSDIHLKDSTYGNDESNSLADYQRALTFYKNNNTDLVAVTGDIVALNTSAGSNAVTSQNEWISELQLFKTYNNTYFAGKPVYAVTGNHDANPNGYYTAVNNANADTEGLNTKIIANGYDGTKSGADVYTEITNQELNYVIEYKDDVYIFATTYYWYYSKFNRDEDSIWLENQLEKYKDKRVFLFSHLPLTNTFEFTNNSQNGFPGSSNGFASSYKFAQLIDKYSNVIWFTGHTHYDFSLQDIYGDDVNLYKADNSMTMIHCSSCSHPRIPNGDSYTNVKAGSKGYLVDVYRDKVVIKGINFATLNDSIKEYTPEIEIIIPSSVTPLQ